MEIEADVIRYTANCGACIANGVDVPFVADTADARDVWLQAHYTHTGHHQAMRGERIDRRRFRVRLEGDKAHP